MFNLLMIYGEIYVEVINIRIIHIGSWVINYNFLSSKHDIIIRTSANLV